MSCFSASVDILRGALKMGYTRKKSLKHPKSSWLKRLKYTIKLKHYQCRGYPIIYMDESGFEQEVIRAFGYTPVGKLCIDIYSKSKIEQVH